MTYNHDIARRNALLGLTESNQNPDTTTPFHGLDAANLAAIIAEGFTTADDNQTRSPTAGRFLAFMRENPEVRAFGYAVHPAREDARVTVEGIACDLLPLTPERRAELRKAWSQWSDADEFVDALQCLYAWWD